MELLLWLALFAGNMIYFNWVIEKHLKFLAGAIPLALVVEAIALKYLMVLIK